MIPRPTESEFAPFYAGYIALVTEEDVAAVLAAQCDEIPRLASGLAAERETYRYAPGKWSVREVVSHLTDAERVFSYRLFRIGRGDETPLAGFDENPYVERSGAHAMKLADLAAEWADARRSSLWLLRRLAPGDWERRGTANNHTVSARALAFILAGHTRHHQNVLRERYGVG